MIIPFLDVGAANDEVRVDLDAAIARVLASGSFILGEEVERFESDYARFVGAAHCVGCGNGLDALALGLRALEIGPGDEVIVPAHTFIATWLAVTGVGATVVPVDCDERTCLLDVARVREAITPATRAVIPVHLYGHAVDLDPLLALAREHGLRVIEDAAQAHGARYRGRPVGAHGDLAAWSFYPSKNLGAIGDAGAVTTDDPTIADRLRMLRNYGSRQKYLHEIRGTNSRLDPLQAAVLGAKLPRLHDWNERRRRIAARYCRELADAGLVLPVQEPWAEHVWHLFVVRSAQRDALMQALAARGVQTVIHYRLPPHLQPAYAPEHGHRDLPVAKRLADQVLSLPMGPQMTDSQVDRVIEAVHDSTRAIRGTGVM